MVTAVVVLSLAPAPQLPEFSADYDDKLAHGLVYTVLMAWFALITPRPRWSILAAQIFALGAGLECAQALLPYRTASLADVFANSCGIIFGVVAAFVLTTGSGSSGRAK